jgi:acetyl esterase/lipase
VVLFSLRFDGPESCVVWGGCGQASSASRSGRLSRTSRRVYRESDSWQRAVGERATVLYLHGGAYCLCGRGSHRELLFRVALQTNAVLLVVEYR